MIRSREITNKTKQLFSLCKLDEWERKVAMTTVHLLLKNNVYDINDQPGCSNLKISLVRDGFNLNYPRTVKVRYSKERNILHPMLGLSGTVYEVSDVEYQFVRDVLNVWNDVQSIILGATYEVEGYKTALLFLKDRKWDDEVEEKAKIIATLCQITDMPLVDLIYQVETGLKILE